MSDDVVHLAGPQVAALKAAVSAGAAESIQDAVNVALDAWLADNALDRLSDSELQQLWSEGMGSGAPVSIDFSALKAEARTRRAKG